MTGPYGEAAWLYWAAGWRGVLPLPSRAKWPPPGGYTGWAGVEPSGADIQSWVDGPEALGNVALRLPVGVYGLDVDAYGTKQGGAALRAAETNLGALPATWTVTSRDDNVSGIRLFRAELGAGRRWKDEPAGHGMGIEAIHFGHRYAVVWPSVHPDTDQKYQLYRPDGSVAEGEVPRVDQLPDMPLAWISALSEEGEIATGEAASHADTRLAVEGFVAGSACDRMTEAAARGMSRLRQAIGGDALHPAARDATHELVRLGHEGHAGARRALAEHYAAFVDVRVRRGEPQRAAEGEWWRLARGAVGKLSGSAASGCDCTALRGEGLLFEMPEPDGSGGDDGNGGEGGAGGLVEALRSRLLSAAQMRALPPPTPLIEGLLTIDSESWMIAKSGSYKTFVCLDMAGHVGLGRPWLGREVRQGEVIYLVAEGVGGMGQRVRAWEQRNGPMSAVRFLPMPVQVKREDHWAALVELCRDIKPVMVILDTQARITVGLNENDNSEMGEFVDAIGRLRRATGACILTVHHLGRSGQDARGASAIDGAQDSELRLTRTADLRVVLETDKQRHYADDARVELELFLCELDGGGSSLVIGAPLSSLPALPDWRANLSLNQAVLVDVMGDIFPLQGATKAELKAEVRKRARHGSASGSPLPAHGFHGGQIEPMGDSSFRRAWDALVDSGRFVKVHGVQRYLLENLVSVDLGVSE